MQIISLLYYDYCRGCVLLFAGTTSNATYSINQIVKKSDNDRGDERNDAERQKWISVRINKSNRWQWQCWFRFSFFFSVSALFLTLSPSLPLPFSLSPPQHILSLSVFPKAHYVGAMAIWQIHNNIDCEWCRLDSWIWPNRSNRQQRVRRSSTVWHRKYQIQWPVCWVTFQATQIQMWTVSKSRS